VNDFDRYLAEVAAAAERCRPMTAKEWLGLGLGLGIPLAFLLLLVAFCPR
jgi:hypothetical protein